MSSSDVTDSSMDEMPDVKGRKVSVGDIDMEDIDSLKVSFKTCYDSCRISTRKCISQKLRKKAKLDNDQYGFEYE